MSALPFVPPSCGQAASDRIEIYSSASLDASVYTCPQHTDEVSLTVMAGGLTPHPVRMPPGTTRCCGHVYVYPTGAFGNER
ncbi:hypothetical protein [Micromonospora avicenniae]|uniref:Uncharacterized protein n=1 Tax=Micromonospora avicenniae TaxID=1198245 RepID=A0A1N7EM11_9ACTN|nr:hypothetical protein [Micromonospora avicenniae]SIR89094.1 hypothetical protein SAMN05444858_1253 [Micromonospora avicenniae]